MGSLNTSSRDDSIAGNGGEKGGSDESSTLEVNVRRSSDREGYPAARSKISAGQRPDRLNRRQWEQDPTRAGYMTTVEQAFFGGLCSTAASAQEAWLPLVQMAANSGWPVQQP